MSFAENTPAFYRRCIPEDFDKTALAELAAQPPGAVVVDFIEERMRLAVMPCGGLVTFSLAATTYTNIRDFKPRLIPAFGEEHRALFAAAIGPFAERLGDRPVILHRALYAEGAWDSAGPNAVLEQFYDLAAEALPRAVIIEVPRAARISTAGHKWGVAPYHDADAYYREFVALMAERAGVDASPRMDVTLQQEPAPQP